MNGVVFTTAMLHMAQRGGVGFVISEDERPVAELTSLRQSPCVVNGVDYRFTQEGAARFWLEDPMGTVGVAHRASATEVLVSCAPHELHLRRLKRFGGVWEVRLDGRVAGSCTLKALSGSADLPGHLPLPVRIFTFYVAIMSRSLSGVGNFSLWS
jgi:hypothetical protein